METHKNISKTDLKTNQEIARHPASQHGEIVRLLPRDNREGAKSLDATRNGDNWEFKSFKTLNAKNGIQNAIKEASLQKAERLLIRVTEWTSLHDVMLGFASGFQKGRAKSILMVDVLWADGTVNSYDVKQFRT